MPVNLEKSNRSKMILQSVTILSVCFLTVLCEDPNHFFLTAAKSVPRIGRSANKNGNSDFEKFFLKASKSVPRIGRRNEGPYDEERNVWDNPMKYSKWNDIAYLYEYQPELFASDDLYSSFDRFLTGDPSVYKNENIRYKRNIQKTSKSGGRK